jgi:hypothetical protein
LPGTGGRPNSSENVLMAMLRRLPRPGLLVSKGSPIGRSNVFCAPLGETMRKRTMRLAISS